MNTPKIQEKVQEIISLEEKRLKADKVFDDLTGLYGDIRVELSRNAPDCENLIDIYADLMAREQQICSPEAAYHMGREAARSERKCNHMEYVTQAFLAPDNQAFLKVRDDLFQKIYGLLENTHDLIDEYTEVYRCCHGTINRKIDLFYEWGYHGTLPEQNSFY